MIRIKTIALAVLLACVAGTTRAAVSYETWFVGSQTQGQPIYSQDGSKNRHVTVRIYAGPENTEIWALDAFSWGTGSYDVYKDYSDPNSPGDVIRYHVHFYCPPQIETGSPSSFETSLYINGAINPNLPPDGEEGDLPDVIVLPRFPPEMPPYIIEDPYYPIPVPPEYNIPDYGYIIPDLPSQPEYPDLPIAPDPINPPPPPDNPEPPPNNPPDTPPNPDPGGGTGAGGSGGDVTIIGKSPGVYDQEQYRDTLAGIDALKARELSAGEIALKIRDVLNANGINDQSIEVRVQQALNNQGLSDYRIGIAVKDALYSQNLNAAAIGQSVEWGLGQRHLSAEEIALEIKASLNSLGLNTDGMENSMQKALANQDLSAGNFEMAFESAMIGVGNTAAGTEIAVENALAYRNLSAAEIGQEVGNQIFGLGLSTKENDDANAQSIVAAIEGISIPSDDSASVVSAIQNLENSLTAEGSVEVDTSITNEDPVSISGQIATASNVVTEIDSVFGTWSTGLVKPGLPSVSTATGITLPTRFGQISATWDYPEVQMIRTFFRWLVYMIFFCGVVMIIRRGIA